MSGQFNSEVLAIQSLRTKYPNAKQKTLAKQIVARNFTDQADKTTAANVGGRSVLSTYSVIRRFDKANAAKLQPAGV